MYAEQEIARQIGELTKQITRVADVLEAIYQPQLMYHNSIKETNKEKNKWKEQANYYSESCQRKNKELSELRTIVDVHNIGDVPRS